MKNWKNKLWGIVLGTAMCLTGTGMMNSFAAPAYGPSVIGPTATGDPYLGGAKLTLLANQSASQMLSAILETKDGSLIVIDGGTPEDADYLLAAIKAKGGHVSAWLITHPHSDHVGALTVILERGDDIVIDKVYSHLASIEWYQANESYRADMVARLAAAMARLPQENLHKNATRGDVITVDDVIIRPLNSPYLFENNAINNSSVAYSIEVNGKYIVFLGDMGEEAGNQLLAEYAGQTIPCDILQMAHHGQYGVSQFVYQALRPKICLWPTPGWLWDNDNGGGYDSGPWKTLETRAWMEKLGVLANYCIKDGDQVIE